MTAPVVHVIDIARTGDNGRGTVPGVEWHCRTCTAAWGWERTTDEAIDQATKHRLDGAA